MSSKKSVIGKVKLCIERGKATPAPPVGSSLGQYGVNIMDFCKLFNERSQEFPEKSLINVKIAIYKDKSMKIEYLKLNSSYIIKKYANISKGANSPGRETAGYITINTLREAASEQMKYLNAYDIENAMKILSGSAKSMGLEVKEEE